jgi:hypothetical protein
MHSNNLGTAWRSVSMLLGPGYTSDWLPAYSHVVRTRARRDTTKARLFCHDTRTHWSHDSLLGSSGTIVQLHGKWHSLVSHKQAYVSQQLAYLGSDVILRLSVCVRVRAVTYFSRHSTVGTHKYRRLCAELEDSIVFPLTCLTVNAGERAPTAYWVGRG